MLISKSTDIRYVAFLRGINVGGHHKVPMSDLREELAKLKFKNVQTLLNSGNIIFDTFYTDRKEIENLIAHSLNRTYGFSIPTLVRRAELIQELILKRPFEKVKVTPSTRLYVSFLKEPIKSAVELPLKSDDGFFEIIDNKNDVVLSVLDVSMNKTTKAMDILEKRFGKELTTRNWNTIEKIGQKLLI